MKKGHFILLNGGSSAGKSTLVEHFQNHAFEYHQKLYLTFGIDSAFYIFPKNIFSSSLRDVRKKMMFDLVNKGDDENPYPVFEHTPRAHKYVEARYRAITQFLNAGFCVIGDEQFWHKPWIDSLKKVFDDQSIYLVKVFADKDILEKRESNRSDRAKNLYISSEDTCHQYMHYDFEIDTSNNDIEKNVQLLWHFVLSNPNPKAIKRL